jgi:hypothetical protein
MIPGIIMLVTVWAAAFAPPTFRARFEPAIEHPLHSVSAARASFCYPVKCVIG